MDQGDSTVNDWNLWKSGEHNPPKSNYNFKKSN